MDPTSQSNTPSPTNANIGTQKYGKMPIPPRPVSSKEIERVSDVPIQKILMKPLNPIVGWIFSHIGRAVEITIQEDPKTSFYFDRAELVKVLSTINQIHPKVIREKVPEALSNYSTIQTVAKSVWGTYLNVSEPPVPSVPIASVKPLGFIRGNILTNLGKAIRLIDDKGAVVYYSKYDLVHQLLNDKGINSEVFLHFPWFANSMMNWLLPEGSKRLETLIKRCQEFKSKNEVEANKFATDLLLEKETPKLDQTDKEVIQIRERLTDLAANPPEPDKTITTPPEATYKGALTDTKSRELRTRQIDGIPTPVYEQTAKDIADRGFKIQVGNKRFDKEPSAHKLGDIFMAMKKQLSKDPAAIALDDKQVNNACQIALTSLAQDFEAPNLVPFQLALEKAVTPTNRQAVVQVWNGRLHVYSMVTCSVLDPSQGGKKLGDVSYTSHIVVDPKSGRTETLPTMWAEGTKAPSLQKVWKAHANFETALDQKSLLDTLMTQLPQLVTQYPVVLQFKPDDMHYDQFAKTFLTVAIAKTNGKAEELKALLKLPARQLMEKLTTTPDSQEIQLPSDFRVHAFLAQLDPVSDTESSNPADILTLTDGPKTVAYSKTQLAQTLMALCPKTKEGMAALNEWSQRDRFNEAVTMLLFGREMTMDRLKTKVQELMTIEPAKFASQLSDKIETEAPVPDREQLQTQQSLLAALKDLPKQPPQIQWVGREMVGGREETVVDEKYGPKKTYLREEKQNVEGQDKSILTNVFKNTVRDVQESPYSIKVGLKDLGSARSNHKVKDIFDELSKLGSQDSKLAAVSEDNRNLAYQYALTFLSQAFESSYLKPLRDFLKDRSLDTTFPDTQIVRQASIEVKKGKIYASITTPIYLGDSMNPKLILAKTQYTRTIIIDPANDSVQLGPTTWGASSSR